MALKRRKRGKSIALGDESFIKLLRNKCFCPIWKKHFRRKRFYYAFINWLRSFELISIC